MTTLADWKAQTFTAQDAVSEQMVAGFHATLEPYLAPIDARCAPLGSHWCLFAPHASMHELGTDGHPVNYPYLPPVPLPRRMWAGGSLEILAPLHVGDSVRRTTSVSDITHKQGRTGELYFVKVHHEYVTSRGCAIRERQDIVYRPAQSANAGDAKDAHSSAGMDQSSRVVWRVATSSSLLFRYSALTFNAHRIHYDLPYATDVEGYAGLVVHGPLQATLLLNAAAISIGAVPTSFEYRGVVPAIAGGMLDVCYAEVGGRLCTRSGSGIVHTTAHV